MVEKPASEVTDEVQVIVLDDADEVPGSLALVLLDWEVVDSPPSVVDARDPDEPSDAEVTITVLVLVED